MEMRRIYDEDFNYQGYMKDRAKRLDPWEYIVVAGVMVISDGKLLITRRATGKTFEHRWEFTMGSVVGEETPLEGALRELSEEVGIRAEKKDVTLLGTLKENQKFSKIFLLKRKIQTVTMQASEVEDYRFVAKDELIRMLEAGEFAEPMAVRIRHYWDKIEGDLV
ncbi:MAG: NUDIX domain-containing protein [Firmicutes bacterium]|nr:NUDIX domain-containing protein [Bacillota bacterium]